MKSIVLVAAAAALLAANPAALAVPPPPASAPVETAPATPAWMPEPKSDQGLVIIFREKRFYGSANSIQVYADEGVALPKVKNGRFVHHYFSPGDHRLWRDKKQRDVRILGVEAGQVYFFEARFEAKQWQGADVDLVPVEYDEGVRRVGALAAG